MHPPVTKTLSSYIPFGLLSEKEKWTADDFMQPGGHDGVRVCDHALIYKADGDTEDNWYKDTGMRSCEHLGKSETVFDDETLVGKTNNDCCDSLSSIPCAYISERCHMNTNHPTSHGTSPGTAETSNEENICEDVTQWQPIYGYPLNGLYFGDDAYFKTIGTHTQNNTSQNPPNKCNNLATNPFHHNLYRHMLIKHPSNLTKVLAARKTKTATNQTMTCDLHNCDTLTTQKSTSEDYEYDCNRVSHPVVVFVSRISDAERFSYYDNVQYKVIKHGYTQDYCGVHMKCDG